MDVSKSGKIFLSDFEGMFTEIQSRRAAEALSSFGSSIKTGSAFSDTSSVLSW